MQRSRSADEQTPLVSSTAVHIKGHFNSPRAPVPILQDPAIRKLLLAATFCSLFMVVEVIGGVWAHSLAILTDAAHLVSDIVGFAISIAAILIARRPATARMSFGFHRAEIMGATFSIFLVWFLTLWLVNEATQRLIARDKNINGSIMMGTACIGLFVNLVMLAIMGHHGHSHGPAQEHGHSQKPSLPHGHGHGHGHSHGHGHGHGHGEAPSAPPAAAAVENMNVRAATVHVIGDLVQTIGVLVAAAFIWHDPAYWFLDPICTYLFSVLVVFTTLPILKESTMILMEGTPVGLHPEEVADMLCDVPGVSEVHDLHIWSIGSGQTDCGAGKNALAVHLSRNPTSKLSTCDILHCAQERLQQAFNITHTTIQIEECESLDCARFDMKCGQNLHSHRSRPSLPRVSST